MSRRPTVSTAVAIALLVVALAWLLRAGLAHASWGAQLAREGSPAPALDPNSSTGYAFGQRHFLALHQRGETYRWIAAAQGLVPPGLGAARHYEADTVPTGRPQLLPTIHAVWIALVAAPIHLVGGASFPVAVERAALWEPVVSHVLAFVAIAAFMGRRFGAWAAAVAGLMVALFPPVSQQFLPGGLTTTPWAMLFAAYAIALHVPAARAAPGPRAFGVRAALAASLALWLDPAFGFPAVLISAAIGAATMRMQAAPRAFLLWSAVGAAATVSAWFIDRSPWAPAAGELRYIHPLYAFAWLGLGLGLDGWQRLRERASPRRMAWAEFAAAVPLVGSLAWVQLATGFDGWLKTGASLRRLTSLEETTAFHSAGAWLAQASPAELFFVLLPGLAAVAAVVMVWMHRRAASADRRAAGLVVASLVIASVLLLAWFKLRWSVTASLLALPIVAGLLPIAPAAARRSAGVLLATVLVALIGWNKDLPGSLRRPSAATGLAPADLEALVVRGFAHWMTTHHPGQPPIALAPPEMADSLVFHGGCRVLMSTAWESYPGLVGASRVLSSLDSSEAAGVIESLGLTHVILTSWDKTLPLLVREAESGDTNSLFARLQRWMLPPFLRAIPYHLPPAPGYADQKIAVFKVTPPEDEALALSRLGEFFVEMDRPQPAGEVAKVLAESFPDDPNAAIARAGIYAHANQRPEFEREIARLVTDVTAGHTLFAWDRRVQRAILLTVGQRTDLARPELEACVNAASIEAVSELTPQQAHRLQMLARRFRLEFPDAEAAKRLAAIGAGAKAGAAATATR